MDLVKELYKAPIVVRYNTDTYTMVQLTFRNKDFFGYAHLHPQDYAYGSKRVGYNIALRRARIEALRWLKGQYENQIKERESFYHEVTGYGARTAAEVDPTGVFARNIQRLKNRQAGVMAQIKLETKNLNAYFEGQTKAIASVKKLRDKDKKD